jgi:hypothetical protein
MESAEDVRHTSSSAFQPWHFFALVILAAATAAIVASRGVGVQGLVMMFLIIATAGAAGLAVFRTLQPLVRPDAGDQTVMVGRRTRTSLERQKMLILRAIKELEFDHAMMKVSDADFQEMTTRLRSRAAGIIRQLEAGDGYREEIEHELRTRLAQQRTTAAPPAHARETVSTHEEPQFAAGVTCATCDTVNESDARFCKACGQKIA